MSNSPPMKLHALKRVGNFSGDTDVERWIDRIEMALRIDQVPGGLQADALAMNLEGAAYDTWKGLSEDSKKNVDAIKTALRSVFGLRRMAAWDLALSLGKIAPGDTADGTFESMKKLVGIAAAGADPVGQIAACMFTARLPTAMRDQVLLRCGKSMKPEEVVDCAKQLWPDAYFPASGGYSATARAQQRTDTTAAKVKQASRKPDLARTRCFNCNRLGHFARDCMEEVSAVSGNGHTGQPQE